MLLYIYAARPGVNNTIWRSKKFVFNSSVRITTPCFVFDIKVGQDDIAGQAIRGTKNPRHARATKNPYCRQGDPEIPRKGKQETNRTWWMGGYMELVQTGHSSSSCTPVAGGTSGPAPAPPPRSAAAATALTVAADLRNGRGSCAGAAGSSSSSMPSV
jgi:hypothetical protein